MSELDIANLYNPVISCGDNKCENYFYEFIYCVVVPGAVVLLLALILAIIMCCKSNSCKCQKKNVNQSQEAEIQLETYNSIRRASASLRQMSQNRETPIMGSRAGSMTLDRASRRGQRFRDSCQSAPGTLQRQHRGRHYEQLSTGSYYQYANDNEMLWRSQQRHSHLSDIDVPSTPPPPPAYSRHSDVFLGAEFLPTNAQASVRYEESPSFDDGGKQVLL